MPGPLCTKRARSCVCVVSTPYHSMYIISTPSSTIWPLRKQTFPLLFLYQKRHGIKTAAPFKSEPVSNASDTSTRPNDVTELSRGTIDPAAFSTCNDAHQFKFHRGLPVPVLVVSFLSDHWPGHPNFSGPFRCPEKLRSAGATCRPSISKQADNVLQGAVTH